jgi:farnesol dehydrogenase
MRVLVTGGTGYLGRAVVRAIAGRGHEVVVFARRASAAGVPGRALDGDIRDGAAVRSAAAGVDAICHAAALVSLWRPDPREFDEVNVEGLRHVIDGCRRHRVGRLVYTSSFLALPPAGEREPLRANDYQRTKAAALRVARDAAARGVPIVTTIPGVIYGPGSDTEGNLVGRLVRDHLAGRLPGLIGADRIWSFAFVDDVAEAHAAALEHGSVGAEYALGGENAPQIRPFELLQRATGAPLPRRIPPHAAGIIAWLEEHRAAWRRRAPVLTEGTVRIFRHDWPLDSAPAIRDLGYRVRPLENGLPSVLNELGMVQS